MRIICHFSLKYERFNFIKQSQTDLTAVLHSPCRQYSDNGFKILYMLWLLVEKPIRMLEMLSSIWISICWQHGDNQKPVHLKSLGAFHSSFINMEVLKKNFRKVSSQIYQSPGHLFETITVHFDSSLHLWTLWLLSHSVYYNMPSDCPHVHHTTMCQMTALIFIMPPYTAWLPSCSIYHTMLLTVHTFITPQYVMWLTCFHCTIWQKEQEILQLILDIQNDLLQTAEIIITFLVLI